MSTYKRRKGTMTPVVLNEGQTLLDKIKDLCEEFKPECEVEEGLSSEYYRDNPVEFLQECLWISSMPYDYYFSEVTNALYKVEYTETEEIDFVDLEIKEDGSIDFNMVYYNSAGYEEYIDEELKSSKF